LENITQFYIKLKNRTVGSHELSSIYFKQVNGTLVIKFFSIIISFIYVPLVLGFLDQEKYGIWVTLTTIATWSRLLDIGIAGGLRLKLSEAIALKDSQKGRIHISTTYAFIGGIFLFCLIVFYLVNPLLNWQSILNTSLVSQSELDRLALIAISFFILGFILQTINQVYLAHGNSIAEGIIQLTISSITLLLIWLASVLAEKGNLILLGTIVTSIPVLVYSIVTVYTFWYKFPHFRPSFNEIKIRESRSLISLSLQNFVTSITYVIIYGSLPFVVAHLFGQNEVAIFNIAYNMFNLPVMLINLLVMPIKPLVTLAFTKKEFDWIRQMLNRLTKMSVVIVAGTIIMILFNQFIYHIWIGDKVTIPYILSATIGIFAIINILQYPFSIIILGTGRLIINVILSPINILLFLSTSIALSKLLNNVIGVAIALAITCLVPLIVYPLWLKKILSEH
jgi:O-antigen/teichoic acid export membrane protein